MVIKRYKAEYTYGADKRKLCYMLSLVLTRVELDVLCVVVLVSFVFFQQFKELGFILRLLLPDFLRDFIKHGKISGVEVSN